MKMRLMRAVARAATIASSAPPRGSSIAGTAGWPPGLYVWDGFGSPTPATAAGIVHGARALIAAGVLRVSNALLQFTSNR